MSTKLPISPIKFVYNLNELFDKISLNQNDNKTPQFEYKMTQGNYKITVNHKYNFHNSLLYIDDIRLDYIPNLNDNNIESIEDNGGGRVGVEHIIYTSIYLFDMNAQFFTNINHKDKKLLDLIYITFEINISLILKKTTDENLFTEKNEELFIPKINLIIEKQPIKFEYIKEDFDNNEQVNFVDNIKTQNINFENFEFSANRNKLRIKNNKTGGNSKNKKKQEKTRKNKKKQEKTRKNKKKQEIKTSSFINYLTIFK
jgi:hypothetical protein